MIGPGDKAGNQTEASPLGGDAGAKPAQPYVVLARKYRPQTLDDLIGQDVLVRTLRNAFAMDRIAQAYMLTGVRGVGKTTTARILARALNYEKPGEIDRPSLDLTEPGVHCRAIMESRHVDVLEMDAASHTGIDDIREIIEAVRYKPASARFRVFIIDEVHMLSKSAFNGLLKTLEEPPPHAKFIFATTEIRKVPVTILSRCQRFDLRRVDANLLASHFDAIVRREGYSAEAEALAFIARASEGSVRDGLSLLDQGLALSQGNLTAKIVLSMLGLSGRAAIFDLVSHIFKGDAKAALAAFAALHDAGGEPVTILTDAADAVHALSRLKVVEGVYPADFSAADCEQASAMAASLSVPRLALAWQMLLKGLEETARASRPLAAAEMLIIRLCYTAQLPSPADVIGELKAAAASPPGAGKLAISRPADGAVLAHTPATQPQAAPPSETMGEAGSSFFAPGSFEDIVDHADRIRDIKIKNALEEHVELVKFGAGFLELHLLQGAPPGLAQDLARKLKAWTGDRWIVSLSENNGLPPLGRRRREEAARAIDDVRRHPAVKSVLHHFPEAEIKGVRSLE